MSPGVVPRMLAAFPCRFAKLIAIAGPDYLNHITKHNILYKPTNSKQDGGSFLAGNHFLIMYLIFLKGGVGSLCSGGNNINDDDD